ncbi:hypothetical protein [Paenibacillus puerhi]|uniref:hypothetical protein n=1 Tax=Paenibacillus puerhi TaxID=2692622 RepID=UPI00135B17CF|nr:hypothetical protein [Paenibacillus puerhi]
MEDFLKEIINPSIAFSGTVGAILVALLSNISKTRHNPLRLFVTLEETQFMSSWTKLLRSICIFIFFVIGGSIYWIFATSIDRDYTNSYLHKTINFIFSPVSLWMTGLVLVLIIVFICFEGIQNKITSLLYGKTSIKRRRSLFILFTMIFLLFYYLFFSIVYGVIINELLLNENSTNIEFMNSIELLFKIDLFDGLIFWIIIFLTILYSIIIFPITKVSKFLGTSKIMVDVFLVSGKRFSGKCLLNSDMDNGILICDSFDKSNPNKHLIPKNNIEYISFNTIYYSLGKQVIIETTSKLVTPKNFNWDERALAKSIMRKK